MTSHTGCRIRTRARAKNTCKPPQDQTPNHVGGGKPYGVDGECVEQCDCGPTNPCGEYIFDHRGGEVDGRNFTEWFVNEYMISNETLLHKDPVTGKPQPIGLGWLDDSMTERGPTEEDNHYVADTNASEADMQSLVGAYKASMQALTNKVLPMGGYWMQLMRSQNPVGPSEKGFPRSNVPIPPAQCKSNLREFCVGANRSATPPSWNRLTLYALPDPTRRTYLSAQNMTDYTAAFLLTRGPYAMIGYSWQGCNNGQTPTKTPPEWYEDYGVPAEDGRACTETGADSGIFAREYSKATVTWDCAAGHGKITTK